MLANSTPGTEAPLDVNVPMVVFGQKLGVTLHAGIVIVVASVMK